MSWRYSALEPEYSEVNRNRKRAAPQKRREPISTKQLDLITASLEAVEKFNESPIEYALGIAAAIALSGHGLRLVAQYQLGRFRYDFAVLHPKIDQVLALVECDGKEFHSSPEQRANDRRKDEAASAAGLLMVRYTGSAIYREPEKCAADLVGCIRRAWRLR